MGSDSCGSGLETDSKTILPFDPATVATETESPQATSARYSECPIGPSAKTVRAEKGSENESSVASPDPQEECPQEEELQEQEQEQKNQHKKSMKSTQTFTMTISSRTPPPPMIIDIYYPHWSLGLRYDVQILSVVLKNILGDQHQIRCYGIGPKVYRDAGNTKQIFEKLNETGDIAIFLERIFNRDFLKNYSQRIFIPNPEWFLEPSVTVLPLQIDTVWHKSRTSLETFKKRYPDIKHYFTGFTSKDPKIQAQDYNSFAHFRGKSQHRNTQKLLNIWSRRPTLPHIRVQLYGPDANVQLPFWMSHGNISLMMGYYKEHADYFKALAESGIHFCTSEVEGFGHYINESRAMGALIVSTDGSPMNELINPTYGFLIPSHKQIEQHAGTRYQVEEDAIENVIEQVLSITPTDRKERGMLARQAFLKDRRQFQNRIAEFFEHEKTTTQN